MKTTDSIDIFEIINESMHDAMVECVEETFESLKGKDVSKEEMDGSLEAVRDILCVLEAKFYMSINERLSSLVDDDEEDGEATILA